MFDIVDISNHTFGCIAPNSVDEVLYRFSISYRISKVNMPSFQDLIIFLGYIADQDEVVVTFTGETDHTLTVLKAVFEDNYNAYVNSLVEDEEVNVLIKVTKKAKNGTISVYRLDLFSAFLKSLSILEIFTNFTELFSANREHIQFRVIDKSGLLLTSTIAFSADEVSWNDDKSRTEMLANCSDASIFLQKTTYAVIPQDFAVLQSTSEFDEISQIFNRLSIVLSYIYLANSANIVGDNAILQFDPKNQGEAYNFAELGNNSNIYKIYEWVYKDINCVDKAGIARGIINLYCKNKADILDIGEHVLSSIKSDYVIYQKNHVEAYIEMKNRISDFILDTGKQIQELTGYLTDGLKNNFLAVIGFALTVILTDSIDLKVWAADEVSPRVIAICGLFVIASICHLVITIISNNSKWNWIEKSYYNLKNNYVNTLDEADIQEAFGNDKIKDDAHKQYKSLRCIVLIIWIVIILAMSGFTWFMSVPLQSYKVQKSTVEDVLIDSKEEVTTPSEAIENPEQSRRVGL